MTTEELRDRAKRAVDNVPAKALSKLVELLESLKVSPESEDDKIIDKILEENKDVLARLAQ